MFCELGIKSLCQPTNPNVQLEMKCTVPKSVRFVFLCIARDLLKSRSWEGLYSAGLVVPSLLIPPVTEASLSSSTSMRSSFCCPCGLAESSSGDSFLSTLSFRYHVCSLLIFFLMFRVTGPSRRHRIRRLSKGGGRRLDV